MAIKTVLKNMARKMSLSEVHAAAQKSIITEAVGESFYNEFKDKGIFKGRCISGATKAEQQALMNKQTLYPIKVRVDGIFDELLPDPCGEEYEENTPAARFVIGLHPTVLPFGPLGTGDRTPGFGEEVYIEFVNSHPNDAGRMRGFRYYYPKQTTKYDYTCANKELQSLVGQFAATGPSAVLGNFVNQGSDRPLSETNLATDGPGMYFGYRKRRKDITHIIVHTTAGWTKAGAIRTLKRKHLSYHYLIDYDGSVEQLIDPVKYVAFHAGRVNDYSIGVSLVNVAYETNKVKEKPIENNTAPWEKRIWYHPKNGRKTNKKWQPFTPEQISSWTVLMKRLVTNFKIKKENIQMHAAVSEKVKMDPGPMLPWDETLDLLYQNNSSENS